MFFEAGTSQNFVKSPPFLCDLWLRASLFGVDLTPALFCGAVKVIAAVEVVKRIFFNKYTAALFSKSDAGDIFAVNVINEKIVAFISKCLLDQKAQCTGADTAPTVFFAQFNMYFRDGRVRF